MDTTFVNLVVFMTQLTMHELDDNNNVEHGRFSLHNRVRNFYGEVVINQHVATDYLDNRFSY